MAQVSFTIPDAILTRVNDGIAKFHGYSATLPDGTPNPQTKAQFNKEKIKETIKNWVVESETGTGAETARTTAQADIAIQD